MDRTKRRFVIITGAFDAPKHTRNFYEYFDRGGLKTYGINVGIVLVTKRHFGLGISTQTTFSAHKDVADISGFSGGPKLSVFPFGGIRRVCPSISGGLRFGHMNRSYLRWTNWPYSHHHSRRVDEKWSVREYFVEIGTSLRVAGPLVATAEIGYAHQQLTNDDDDRTASGGVISSRLGIGFRLSE
jgi:hypothetical protein